MTVPSATYRLQLRPGFGFDEAAAVVPYLAELGVSHVYCSPYLQAAAGSTHGYDVVDHSRVNDELGGAEAHARFVAALRAHGLGQVLDIVPNHMAITGSANEWWWDVLENGPSSVYASFFDVDWDPPETKLRHTVLLPILGDHYGRVLEAGELALERDGGSFIVRYHEHTAPVAPRSLDDLLAAAAARSDSDELASIATACGRLPHSTATDRASVQERHRDKEVLRARLDRLFEEQPTVATAVEEVVAEVNRDPDALDALLERQNYRLAYWRTAGRELDYRRFFDITTLVGLRVEDEQVFAETHDLVLQWVTEGAVDGLRIDHPDGLRDPEGYLRRLRSRAPDAWIVVEKILEPGERLPRTWPVAGTTGYDFLNQLTWLFVDPEGEAPLTQLYAEVTGMPTDYGAVTYEKKRQVLRDVLGADLNRLTALFVDVCERNRRYRDYSRHELHEALREVVACFPVYRTYGRADDRFISEDDVVCIHRAVADAKERRDDLDHDLLDFLGAILMLRVDGDDAAELAMRVQQLTGPAMAKGVEDTAFYAFNRLVSLNEVGGDPGHFSRDTWVFHQANEEAVAHWPARMTTTSTHDTKRSEDVRARISLLSEIPNAWADAVRRWVATNERHRLGEHDMVDRNAEYLLYQTLVGAWPLDVHRAVAYMEKAAKEAKTHTSWVDPNTGYDAALRAFVENVLADAAFTDDLAAFVAPLIEPGRVMSLAQTLLKLTSPGVPDVYQGTELWDLSLVDPDNRRPVDYDERRRLLADPTQHPKLLVTHRTLRLRRERPDLLGVDASYRPVLGAEGGTAALAFERGGGAVTVVPRLLLSRPDEWRAAVVLLEPGSWRDVFTGEVFDGGKQTAGDLLSSFPVGLLVRQ